MTLIPKDYAKQIDQYRRHRDRAKLSQSLPIANPREKQAVIDWIVKNVR